VRFEFDEKKSELNQGKHGISLENARRLWEDPDIIVGPATSIGEERWAAVGMIGDIHWLAVFTYRGDSIRLITCRRARPEEIETYEASK